MTDQSNVFDAPVNQNQDQQQQTQSAPSLEAYNQLLASIKNEQGTQKYDSLPKALEGLANAQQYIPQLKTELQQKEAELAELRNKLAQQASIEDVVSRLTAKQAQTQVESPTQASGLDEKAVLELLERQIAQRESASRASANAQTVHEALASKYGDKAQDVVAAKAQELGTTPQELGKLAAQNPKLVLGLFNTSTPSGPKPTVNGLNTSGFQQAPQQPLERPSKSLLRGATSKEQAEFMRKIKEQVYARHGISQ